MSQSKSALVIPTKGEVNGVMQYKNGSHRRITLKPSVNGEAYECTAEDAKFLESTGDFSIADTKSKKATNDKTGGGK